MRVHGDVNTCTMRDMFVIWILQKQHTTTKSRDNVDGAVQCWDLPAMVPYTTVPFLSSIWTFSLESFIKNLQLQEKRTTVSNMGQSR
jgi:hypothetical protein